MPAVTISQPAVINVKVGNKPATVQSITYGSRTLKSATDLTISGGNTGDVITYDAANNNFHVSPVTATVTDIDAGTF
jgi:hypothetical protein